MTGSVNRRMERLSDQGMAFAGIESRADAARVLLERGKKTLGTARQLSHRPCPPIALLDPSPGILWYRSLGPLRGGIVWLMGGGREDRERDQLAGIARLAAGVASPFELQQRAMELNAKRDNYYDPSLVDHVVSELRLAADEQIRVLQQDVNDLELTGQRCIRSSAELLTDSEILPLFECSPWDTQTLATARSAIQILETIRKEHYIAYPGACSVFAAGISQLSDYAATLDFLQTLNPVLENDSPDEHAVRSKFSAAQNVLRVMESRHSRGALLISRVLRSLHFAVETFPVWTGFLRESREEPWDAFLAQQRVQWAIRQREQLKNVVACHEPRMALWVSRVFEACATSALQKLADVNAASRALA